MMHLLLISMEEEEIYRVGTEVFAMVMIEKESTPLEQSVFKN